MPKMPRLSPLLLCLAATLPAPALRAEEAAPNFSVTAAAEPGSLARLYLAWQVQDQALQREDPVLMLGAIRLARSVGLRAATGWTGPEAATDPVDPALPGDPAADGAMALALILAEGDPDVEDLAATVEAELRRPGHARGQVSALTAEIAAGASSSYRIVFFGELPAEVAMIGDGGGNIDLRVTDEAGHLACAEAGPADRAFCAFTPAWNGFFTVTISNPGAQPRRYRLMTN